MDTLTHAVAGACIASAAAQQTVPEFTAVAACVGFVAALLPDLDYLFVFAKRPLLAWKYHRVALHNVFVLPVLALCALAISYGLSSIALLWAPEWNQHAAFNTHLPELFELACIALISHLLLDYITSFGSAFFFPLSRRRFALGSHFLTDPVVMVIMALGWVFDEAGTAVLVLTAYLLMALVLKYLATRKATTLWRSLKIESAPPKLFPRPGAPWRWLAIAEQSSHYAFFYVTPYKTSEINWLDKGLGTRAYKLYKNDPLLEYFIGLSAFPRFEDTQRQNQPAIVVEDLQWWWALPTRPMAFSALVDQEEITSVRESKKLDKGPTGEPATPPFIEKPKV